MNREPIFERAVLPLPPSIAQAGLGVGEHSYEAEFGRMAEWEARVGVAAPAGACDKRRMDFVFSRLCLREAQTPAESSQAVAGRSSLTHAHGPSNFWTWCAVSSDPEVAVGVDTESLLTTWSDASVPDKLQDKFLGPSERALLGREGLDWRVVFSAKESIFKALSSGRNVNPIFREVVWVARVGDRLQFEFGGSRYEVVFAVTPDWVHTACVLRI